MLKKIIAVIAVLLLLIVGVGFILPRHAHVSRSVTINRPASLVYATVNSFLLFPSWSPWQDLDPNMHQTAEGPRDGVGAKLIWSGNDKVGSGTQLITASTLDSSVASDLDFNSMGAAKSLISLTAEGAATKATWTLDIDMGANPIGHYFGLTMDSMIGKDFATGLAKLKTLVESMPNADIAGFTAEEVQLIPAPILLVTETTPMAGIADGYIDAFGKIFKFMAKNKLHQAGAPLGIEVGMDAGSYTFDAAIPVDRGDAASADSVSVTHSYAGKALKTIHLGSYDRLGDTNQKLTAYISVHGYTQKGPILSSFIDDPGKVPVETLRTEVYAPVE